MAAHGEQSARCDVAGVRTERDGLEKVCEYYCAFANSGKSSMVKALKDHKIAPRIRIEERNNIS
ncbi:MAG: hypothetical protein UDM04_07560, partial [Agathobaculum sp.]|nr:hypothetical protein [Agathobaculum sp.]